MSPFESVSERLGLAVANLPLQGQVALLACASRVLIPQYLDWCAHSGASDQSELLHRALETADRFATGRITAIPESLQAAVEVATPSEPTDISEFTAAQDCWVCADSAIQVTMGQFEAKDASWYLLEPVFQATSERLFGFYDVGSQDEDSAEGAALADPALSAAVHALESAIGYLSERVSLGESDLERVTAIVRPISP